MEEVTVGFGCGRLLYEALGGGNSQVILVLIVGAVGEFIVIWVLVLVDGRMGGYLLLRSCGLCHFLWGQLLATPSEAGPSDHQ